MKKGENSKQNRSKNLKRKRKQDKIKCGKRAKKQKIRVRQKEEGKEEVETKIYERWDENNESEDEFD